MKRNRWICCWQPHTETPPHYNIVPTPSSCNQFVHLHFWFGEKTLIQRKIRLLNIHLHAKCEALRGSFGSKNSRGYCFPLPPLCRTIVSHCRGMVALYSRPPPPPSSHLLVAVKCTFYLTSLEAIKLNIWCFTMGHQQKSWLIETFKIMTFGFFTRWDDGLLFFGRRALMCLSKLQTFFFFLRLYTVPCDLIDSREYIFG